MGGAGDRILVHADGRREETRHKIEPRRAREARHDDAARLDPFQPREIDFDRPHDALGFDLDDIVELISPDVQGMHAERFDEPLGSGGGR